MREREGKGGREREGKRECEREGTRKRPKREREGEIEGEIDL